MNAFVSTVFFTLLFLIGGCASGLPTKSECIVGVILKWDNPDSRTLNKIGELYSLALADGAGGLSIIEDRFVYLIYKENCKNKTKIANGFFLELSKRIDGFPNYEFMEYKIDPGPKTISVSGKYWRD